jgi:hypothetical protein
LSGFEQLEQAIVAPNTAEVLPEKVAWRGETWDDETALAIVLADANTAKAFISSKNMTVDWERADNNFRAFGLPKNWPGVESQRAGLSMTVVMEAVEKLEAAIMLSLFSDPQPFLLEAIGQANPGILRAKSSLLQWGIQLSDFKEETRKCIKSALLYGFLVGKWGWKKSKIRDKKYEMATDGSKTVKKIKKDYEIAHPTFENIELRNHLGDPSLRDSDARKGRFNLIQIFPDASILDDLRNDPAYKNVPTREELAQIMAERAAAATDSMDTSKNMSWRDNQAAKETDRQSLDPLKAPLEILEWIDNDRIVTVLQRLIVIRNEELEFGRTPLVSCSFIDVPGAMYGFGISKLLAGEQYLQTSVVNSWLDVVALALNPAFTAEQGLQTTAQNVKVTAGKILTGSKLTPIPIPDVGPQALNVLQTSEDRAARRVGANGGSNMPTQALRTAEGVQSFGQDVVDKLQNFIEKYCEKVFIPTLEAFLDVIHDNLQPDDINRILTEIDGKAYEGSILDVYNTRCRIKVLASTKIAARKAASQLAPLIMNLVMSSAVQQALAAQGVKFNFAEFLEQIIDLTGWDVKSLIVPATKDDIDRSMQMQAGQAIKAQADLQKQQQQAQDALQQIEEKGFVQAGVAVVKHTLKASEEGNAPSK